MVAKRLAAAVHAADVEVYIPYVGRVTGVRGPGPIVKGLNFQKRVTHWQGRTATSYVDQTFQLIDTG